MTTELVLLLGIYAFIVIGVFLGDLGPVATFNRSVPRLAGHIERNVNIGHRFNTKGGGPTTWKAPQSAR